MKLIHLDRYDNYPPFKATDAITIITDRVYPFAMIFHSKNFLQQTCYVIHVLFIYTSIYPQHVLWNLLMKSSLDYTFVLLYKDVQKQSIVYKKRKRIYSLYSRYDLS